MRIRLLAFASAADALGAPEVEIEVPAGGRVRDLQALLDVRFPSLTPLWPRLAIAVDSEIVGLDAALAPGSEVALLPPVSGGSERSRAELTEAPIDPAAVVAAVAGPGRGAVLLFLGNVRDSHQGRAVVKLTYTAYRPMARAGLARIVADLESAAPGLCAAIVHRLGEVPVGEASVAVAIASPHRAAAYAASRTALERLKTEIPIWKREHFADGDATWREVEPLRVSPPTPRAGS